MENLSRRWFLGALLASPAAASLPWMPILERVAGPMTATEVLARREAAIKAEKLFIQRYNQQMLELMYDRLKPLIDNIVRD